MNCEAKFLDALGVELQRLPSLRLVWCQSSGRVWCSAGLRQRFGLTATFFDELAGWGLIHPEDHSRVLEAFEALTSSPEPVLVRGLRMLLAPGVWSEFDIVYSRLGCGGVFGGFPEPCGRCGLVMVSMREHVAGNWVEAVDVLEGEESEAPAGAVAIGDAVEAEETELPAVEAVEAAPTGRELAIARDALGYGSTAAWAHPIVISREKNRRQAWNAFLCAVLAFAVFQLLVQGHLHGVRSLSNVWPELMRIVRSLANVWPYVVAVGVLAVFFVVLCIRDYRRERSSAQCEAAAETWQRKRNGESGDL